MYPVYVVTQGAKLRINNRRLQVELDGDGGTEVLMSVPLGQISEVVLFGNIGITTPAIDTLLGQNCEITFLTQNGAFRGRIIGGMTPHVPLRRAQYRALEQPNFVLKMACGFVKAKIEHQRALLQRHNRDHPHADIDSAITQLERARREVERKVQLSSLRGLEGASTAAYFSGFRLLFDPRWQFTHRNRRPPADPVNVLLSLGYTLLTEAASSAVRTVGLDPYAGFLHEVVYNRPALALDLAEEFRPVVDGVVLWCCRSEQITPDDFSSGTAERPCILGDSAKRCFIQAFEQRMEQTFTHPLRNQKMPLRQCLIEQARQVAQRLLAAEAGYVSMGFR